MSSNWTGLPPGSPWPESSSSREPKSDRERSRGPRASKKSGLAITSLVLGIVALVLCVIPIINFFGMFLGGLAVVFGIVGIVVANGVKRSGRGFGIAGLILGALALIGGILINALFFGAVAAVDDALNVEVDTSSAGGAAGTSSDPLPFGTEITLENGLIVKVGEPKEFTPSSEVLVTAGENYFWAVEVSLTNTGPEDLSVLTTSNGYLASGAACSSTFDSAQFGDQLLVLDGSLPRGKTRSGFLAFACPSSGQVELEFGPDPFSEKVFFSQAAAKP